MNFPDLEEVKSKYSAIIPFIKNIAVASTTQWSQNARAENSVMLTLLKTMMSCYYRSVLTIQPVQVCMRKKAVKQLPLSYTGFLGQTKQGWNNTLGDWREIISGGFENGGL